MANIRATNRRKFTVAPPLPLPYKSYMKGFMEKIEQPLQIAIKSDRLKWDIFFQDDEKLMSYYIATQMNGQFFGVKAPLKPLNSGGYELDIGSLKSLFNTTYTTINYLNLRYKHKPELIREFINSKIALNSGSSMTLIAHNADESRNKVMKTVPGSHAYIEMSLPEYASSFLSNWEFLNKISQELTALEKTDNIYYTDLFHQILHYYYYNTVFNYPVEKETFNYPF